MLTPTLYQFYTLVHQEHRNQPTSRHGQVVFFLMHELKPALARAVSGTRLDPYYMEKGSPDWRLFIQWVEENWYSPQPQAPSA